MYQDLLGEDHLAGAGALIVSGSQCSSALPSTKRQVSNHDVLYFLPGLFGLSVSAVAVSTVTYRPSALTAPTFAGSAPPGAWRVIFRPSVKKTTPPSPPRPRSGWA